MKNRKKLVYVLHDISMGGVEVALLSAIPKLNQQYDLRVIVLGTIDKKLVNNLSDDERKVFEAFNYPLYLYPVFLPKVISTILQFKPDMMICSLWRASLVGVFVKFFNKKIKFFSFNHSTRFPHKLSSFFTWSAAKTADVVLTDGIATKDFVQQRLSPKGPIRIVSFLTQLTPDMIQKDIPSDGFIHFMFLGRINKVKNLPLVIEVIRYLNENQIPAKLDIYGRNDGNMSDTEAIISGYKLQDLISFKGEIGVDARSSLFGKYHFYIQLSSFEGMAMSVAEAMQHGLVCVVSPVGEIVHYARDMESAIFIDIFKDTWQDDIQKILKVIQDEALYSKISQNCHQNFVNKPEYPSSLIEELERV